MYLPLLYYFKAVVCRLYEMLYPCICNVVISCWKSGAYGYVICRGVTGMCFVPGSGWKHLDLEQYRISGLTPNENPHIIHNCLMAKTTSVTSHSKPFTPTNPSLLDCVEEKEELKEQEENEFELFMSKLKGVAKGHFVALLEQLGEAHAHIEQLDET